MNWLILRYDIWMLLFDVCVHQPPCTMLNRLNDTAQQKYKMVDCLVCGDPLSDLGILGDLGDSDIC